MSGYWRRNPQESCLWTMEQPIWWNLYISFEDDFKFFIFAIDSFMQFIYDKGSFPHEFKLVNVIPLNLMILVYLTSRMPFMVLMDKLIKSVDIGNCVFRVYLDFSWDYYRGTRNSAAWPWIISPVLRAPARRCKEGAHYTYGRLWQH